MGIIAMLLPNNTNRKNRLNSLRNVFGDAISTLMFACGGERKPLATTVELIGKIVILFMQRLLYHSLKLSSTRELDWRNILVILQRDPYSAMRAKELIEFKENVTATIQNTEAFR